MHALSKALVGASALMLTATTAPAAVICKWRGRLLARSWQAGIQARAEAAYSSRWLALVPLRAL